MSTDFNKNVIHSSGGFIPVSTNTPIDQRTIVETEADIVNIPNPFIGMIVYVKDTKQRFEITALKPKKSGFASIPDALVDVYVAYDPAKDFGYAKQDEVDETLAGKVDKEDGKILIDQAEAERLANVDNYDDAAIIERLNVLEAIDHEEFLKEHQAIDHLAVKEEVDAALELKADKADLEGLANEQFVNDRIAEVIGEAPEALDTLKEIADAMEAHEDIYEAYVETVKTALDAKADAAEVEERFAVLEAIDHEAFLTEHQDISHLAVKADVDAAIAAHEEEAQTKFEAVEAKHVEDMEAIEAEIAEVKVLIDEEKPYLADVAAYPTSKFLFACGQPMTVEPNTGFKYDANYAEDDVAFVYRWNDGFECIMVEKAIAEKVYVVGGFGDKNVGARRSIPQTNILVRDVKIKGVVGGCYFEGMVGHVDMELENAEFVSVMGGGWCGASVNGKATRMNIADDVNIKATNCKISSTLFGGSQGNGVVDDVRMELNNCEIGWLTAGGSNGMTRDAVVVMNGGSVRVAQSTNRGVVHKARFVLNDGVVNKLYFGGETEDTTVNGLIEDGFVELNGGTVKQFCFGTDNGVELFAEDIKGCIMNCVVEAGDVSMLEVKVPEPEIDFSIFAKKEDIPAVDVDKAYVDGQVEIINNRIDNLDQVGQYDDTVLVNRIERLEEIDHGMYLTEHQDISHLATKAELHAQPNFEYKVEVVDAAEEAKFEVSGEFPNLVITLKLPMCYSTPPDLSTTPMYYGYIPFDQEAYDAGIAGTMGFTTVEEIGPDMDMKVINFGIDHGSLNVVNPEPLGKVEIREVELASYLCVLAPKSAKIKAYLDNGVGDKLTFSEINSEDGSTGYLYCQDGVTLNSKINDVDYVIYGAYITTETTYYVHIEQEA